MDTLYIILILASIAIPIALHAKLKRKIRRKRLLLFTELTIGVTILVAALVVPSFSFFSMPEYPKITKIIDRQYYFTQEEYGWAGNMPGKHLDFFKSRKFWFDEKVGHIQWLMGTGDIDAKIFDQNSNKLKRLVLTENKKLVLDTTVVFDNNFDYRYLTWRN